MLDIVDVSLPPFLSDFLFCSLPTYFEELNFSFLFLPILCSVSFCWTCLSNCIETCYPYVQCYDCGASGHSARLCRAEERNKCGRCHAGRGDWGGQGEHHTKDCGQCFDCGQHGHWANKCDANERRRCGNCMRGLGEWGKQGMHHTQHCRQQEENTSDLKRTQLFLKILLYASFWYFPEGEPISFVPFIRMLCWILNVNVVVCIDMNENSYHKSRRLVSLRRHRLWRVCTDTIPITRLFDTVPWGNDENEKCSCCVDGDLVWIRYPFVLLSSIEAQQTGLRFALHGLCGYCLLLIDLCSHLLFTQILNPGTESLEKDLMVRSETSALKNMSFLYQAYKPKFWYAEVNRVLLQSTYS